MDSRGDVSLPVRAGDIVIGSSPLMMLHALDLARSGRDVVLVEQVWTLGGAWYSPSRLGFEGVEAGVHLIENRRAVYRRLESLGVDLAAEGRFAFGVWRGRRIPLSAARLVSFLGVLARSMLKVDRNAVKTTLPRAVRSLASLCVPFRYPRGGAVAMVEALARRLDESGVLLIRGCRIDQVVLWSGTAGGVCRTSLGDVEFENFHFSSRAHCSVRIGEVLLDRVTRFRETFSLLLVVDRCSVSEFSYVEILGDRLLRRVRDVTDFARPSPSKSLRVLCVQLRESGFDVAESLDRCARRVIRRLGELGLMEGEAEVLGADLDRFTYQTLSDGDLDALSSRHASLVSIKTTDFAEDMLRLID